MKRVCNLTLFSGLFLCLALHHTLPAMQVCQQEVPVALRDGEKGILFEHEWTALKELSAVLRNGEIEQNEGPINLIGLTAAGLDALRSHLSVLALKEGYVEVRELMLRLLEEDSQDFHNLMVAADYLELEALIKECLWFFNTYFILTFPPSLGQSLTAVDKGSLKKMVVLPSTLSEDLRIAKKKSLEGTFHWAAQKGDTETLKFLLDYVDIDCVDFMGRTALMLCAEHEAGGALAEFLLGKGASVVPKDRFGRNALIYGVSASGDRSRFMETLLQHAEGKIDINEAVSSNGLTPLMYAAQKGNAQEVGLLLSRGADVTLKDMLHSNALILACSSNGDCVDVVKLLVEHENIPKLDIDEMNRNQHTALMCAAQQGNEKIVSLLLAKGARVGINKALSLAIKHAKSERLVTLLIENGAIKDASDGVIEEEDYAELW